MNFSVRLVLVLAAIGNILVAAPSVAQNYSMTILQPRANADLRSRYAKAYPGLEYNVRLAVTGGQYPYRYQLVEGPPGMSIDGRGEIRWSNPTKAGSPHRVAVRVTDSASSTAIVQWSVTVTEDGFRFLDAVYGRSASQGGTGTRENPWRSLADVYEGADYDAKYRDTYSGEFLYWRSGVYSLDAYKENCGSNCRVPFMGNNKPQVWLAYPGEKPILDFNRGGNDAHVAFYSTSGHVYVDGLTFEVDNSRGMGLVIESSTNDVTIRRNTFYGITTGYTGGNNALLFISNGNSGRNYSIQDNVAYDVNNGYWLLGYSARDVLVEDNNVRNIYPHPISPKTNTQQWTIRSNDIVGSGHGITVQYYPTSGNIEILFNLIRMTSGEAVRINTERTASGGPVYVYRNTLIGDVDAISAGASNGPFVFERNVIVNNAGSDGISRISISNASRVVSRDNLSGKPSDGIVDGKGNLTPAYSQYLGIRGHQISASSPRPRAPQNLRID